MKEIETKLKRHNVTILHAGSKMGTTINICTREYLNPGTVEDFIKEGHIVLDMMESYHLACTLIDFVKETIKKRQGYLREQIDGLKKYEKTIFAEARNLDMETLGLEAPLGLGIEMIDRICPKEAPSKDAQDLNDIFEE